MISNVCRIYAVQIYLWMPFHPLTFFIMFWQRFRLLCAFIHCIAKSLIILWLFLFQFKWIVHTTKWDMPVERIEGQKVEKSCPITCMIVLVLWRQQVAKLARPVWKTGQTGRARRFWLWTSDVARIIQWL